MNLTSLITDNISEIISKIIDFTHNRQKILLRNIKNLHTTGYVPMDLEVDEFSDLLTNAISEHVRCHRLMLCDTENIKFGPQGSFAIKPIIDEHAEELLKENPDEYIELQVNKRLENSLNQKIATELLRQKQGMVSIFG